MTKTTTMKMTMTMALALFAAACDVAPLDEAPATTTTEAALTALGSYCVSNADCGTGNCVDNVCCDSACAGPCSSCKLWPGYCMLAPNQQDPRNACGAYTCNGAGACKTSCSASADCARGYACSGGTCVKPEGTNLPAGSPCVTEYQCASGLGCTAMVGDVPRCTPYACPGNSNGCKGVNATGACVQAPTYTACTRSTACNCTWFVGRRVYQQPGQTACNPTGACGCWCSTLNVWR